MTFNCKSLLEDYPTNLKPRNQNMIYPVQLSLFDDSKCCGQGLRTRLGNYYELLTQGIYGGDIKERQNTQNGNSSLDNVISEPDVSSEHLFREVKSTSYHDALKLFDNQIAKYFILATQGNHSKKIRFDIFIHDIKKLQTNYSNKSLEYLLEDLTKSTKFCISLPFSLLFDIYSSNSQLTSRYEGDKYYTLTRIKSKGLKEFICHPEETLRKIGKNPEDFEIKKMRFSEGNLINQMKIEPFPILLIEDKKYGFWIEKMKNLFEAKYNPASDEYDRIVNEIRSINIPENFILAYEQLTNPNFNKYPSEKDSGEEENFWLNAWNPGDDLPF